MVLILRSRSLLPRPIVAIETHCILPIMHE
jgi:hypothetical protein